MRTRLLFTCAFSHLAFSLTAGAQCHEALLIAGDPQDGALLGCAAALDGDTAVLGAYKYFPGVSQGIGGAYVFVRAGGVWSQQGQLLETASSEENYFGYSVGVSGDSVIVGAPYTPGMTGKLQGSAYVFVRSGTTWTKQADVLPLDPNAGDYFGMSVAINGDTAVVGAHRDDDWDIDCGSAYVFVRTGSIWTQQAKLTAADAQKEDYFGAAVAIDGDTIAIGAHGEDEKGSYAGAVYVFTRSGSIWNQQAKLTAADAEAGDFFGWSLALAGNALAVGAPLEDEGGQEAGAAYAFRRSGIAWNQEAKFVAWDAENDDEFGKSVAVDGDVIAVGSPYHDLLTVKNTGSVYVYVHEANEWRHRARYPSSATVSDGEIGASLGVSGDTVLAGAPASDLLPMSSTGAGDAFTVESLGTSYGIGCPGTTGVYPLLLLDGCPDAPAIAHLEITQGLGQSTALLFFGLVAGALPMGSGCSLLVSPLFPIVTVIPLLGLGPGEGFMWFDIAIPPSAAPGTVTMQAFIIEPALPHGYSATNGVRVTLP